MKYLSGGSRHKKHKSNDESASSSTETETDEARAAAGTVMRSESRIVIKLSGLASHEVLVCAAFDEVTAMSITRAIVKEPVLIACLASKGVNGVAAAAGYAHVMIQDDAGSLYSAGYNDRCALCCGLLCDCIAPWFRVC